jgi:hypothetical protein
MASVTTELPNIDRASLGTLHFKEDTTLQEQLGY